LSKKWFYDDKTMCPLKRNRLELCKDGLSSLMIEKQYCFIQSYERCPIYLIEARKKGSIENENLDEANHG
jgi:hypothetical protein